MLSSCTTHAAAPLDAGCALTLRQLTCRRGGRALFQNLSAHLAPGSITWLRGANGSGKTSLLRVIAGLAPPESGDIYIGGLPVRSAASFWHRNLVYVGHGNALKDDLSLGEAAGFLARMQGYKDGAQRAEAALERLGLGPQRKALVRTLSQGQRRRGALVRLALHEAPCAWLLDEPYDALDHEGIAQLDALIERNAANGGLVLMTSHQAVTLRKAQAFTLIGGVLR